MAIKASETLSPAVPRSRAIGVQGKSTCNLSPNASEFHAVSESLAVLGQSSDSPNSAASIGTSCHPSAKARYVAVRHLGRAVSLDLLPHLRKVAQEDADTMVRREAVSAVGRLRSEVAIPTLLHLLGDRDPKVVLQAIRGLLVFKSKPSVRKALEELERHENEIVREIIASELHQTRVAGLQGSEQDHADYPRVLRNIIVCGDALNVLKSTPRDSIHLTFTSPPYYNARDYSIYPSYEKYLEGMAKIFRQVHRVTKEGRFFVLNTSPVIVPRVSRKHSSTRYPIPFDIHPLLLKMGWEFIDDIVWVKPEASVKNRNAGFLQHRKPLAYKPNARTEYLMVYRKKTNRLIDWNMRQYSPEIVRSSLVDGDYDSSNVWNIDPTFDRNHTAVFPVELCKRVIRYYSFASDLVFDPFGGSGTMARAAIELARNFFTVEISPKYVRRIQENLNKCDTLFAGLPRTMSFNEFKRSLRAAK